MKPKIYRFTFEGNRYYGSGLREDCIKSALETKLRLPQGSLSKGSSYLSSEEITRVKYPHTSLNDLCKKLKIEKGETKTTLESLAASRGSGVNDLLNIVSKSLNIPKARMEKFISESNEPIAIHDFLSISNNRVLVKTSKPLESGYTRGERNYISRSDEFVRNIQMLLGRDFNLVVEMLRLDDELEKLKSTMRKSSHAISPSGRDRLSFEEFVKHEKIVSQTSIKLTSLEQRVSSYNNVCYHTGYYVNALDWYEFPDYKSVCEAFDNCYDKISTKIQKHFMQNYIPRGWKFSLGEMLDAHCVTGRNDYKGYKLKVE